MLPSAQVIWSPRDVSLGVTNALLVARSRKHAVSEFPGPLSIKTVTEGRVAWRVERRNIWVDSTSFLVLNAGEPYSMNIDSSEPVATSCVFFQTGFVESVHQCLVCAEAEHADEPERTKPVRFLAPLHPARPRLAALMRLVRRTLINGLPPDVLDDCYLKLAAELLFCQENVLQEIARVPAIRKTTRTELYKRVARGREFLHAEFSNQVGLGDAARAAGMSVYHFQRTFTRAFGVSPSRYLTQLRLNRAVHLLQAGLSVTDTCAAVGYQSLGSFSTMFRGYWGVQPSSLQK